MHNIMQHANAIIMHAYISIFIAIFNKIAYPLSISDFVVLVSL